MAAGGFFQNVVLRKPEIVGTAGVSTRNFIQTNPPGGLSFYRQSGLQKPWNSWAFFFRGHQIRIFLNKRHLRRIHFGFCSCRDGKSAGHQYTDGVAQRSRQLWKLRIRKPDGGAIGGINAAILIRSGFLHHGKCQGIGLWFFTFGIWFGRTGHQSRNQYKQSENK